MLKLFSKIATSGAATLPKIATPLLATQVQPKASMSSVPKEVWNLGRLNHVAIAVHDIDKATEFYKNVLNAKSVSKKMEQPEHGVYTVFIDLGNTKIELLHPLGNNSPIQGFLNKNANGGIHHICIEVDDIHKAMKQLTKAKIRCLADEPRLGAHGKSVVFLHPKDCYGTLVELEQA